MNNITVAVDFSDLTQSLLDQAVKLGVAFKSKVHLIHVVAPEPAFVGYEAYAYPGPDQREEELADEKARLRAMVNDITDRGVSEAAAYMEEGETVPTLLKFAGEHRSDLIIIGSHHHNFLERLLLGSTANDAVRKAEVPVMVIPTGD